MNRYICRHGRYGVLPSWLQFTEGVRGGLVLVCLWLALEAGTPKAVGAIAATLMPASTSSVATSPVVLQVTGLATGATVMVERFADADADGVVDVGEFLAERFTVTNGQVSLIDGVRNTNVPGDEDGAADGQISINLTPALGPEMGRLAGKQIIRVSSPTSAFTAFTRTLTITQPVEAQAISGTVTDGANPVPNAGIVLIAGSGGGGFLLGVVANAAGHFSVNAAVGSYQVVAIKTGYVTNFATAPMVTIGAGATVTQNIQVAVGTTTISGKVADASTGAGLGGVQLFVQDQDGQATVVSSQANGTYSVPCIAGQWQLRASELSLTHLGYLCLSDQGGGITADTTSGAATGVNVTVPRATALIHGTVTNSGSTPLAGIQMGADDSAGSFYSVGTSDAHGHYVLGVTMGAWSAYVSDESPGLAGYLVPDMQHVTVTGGQAVQAIFTMLTVNAHLQGVVTNAGTPVVGISLVAEQQTGNRYITVQTTLNGAFDFGLVVGTWKLRVESSRSSAALFNIVSPLITYTLSENQLISGIVFAVQTATGTLSGTVRDANNQPLGGITVYATATIDGVLYYADAEGQTDANGHYSFPVINGTWLVTANGPYLHFSQQLVTVSGSATVNVVPSPITGQPQPQSVTVGAPAIFSVQTNTPGASTMQWQLFTTSGSVWSNLSNNPPYSGATTNTLTIRPTTSALSGNQYRCLVTSGTGANFDVSQAAELTVNTGSGLLKWSLALNGGPVYYSAPAIGPGGTIYVGSGAPFDYTSTPGLYAVNPDGTLKWHYANANMSYMFTPSVGADGTIYVQDYTSSLYAVNPDGTLKWKYPFSKYSEVGQTAPAIALDGTIYVGADCLYAINPDGTLKWRNTAGGNTVRSSPAIDANGTVYFGTNLLGGRLQAINPDGTLKWIHALEGADWVFSSPAIGTDGTIYIGAESSGDLSYVYAVKADGTLKWRYEVTGGRTVRSSPTLGVDGTIYIGTKASATANADFLALNPGGTLKWKYGIDVPQADIYCSPTIGADGIIYFGAETGFLYALNPNGTLAWQYGTNKGINWTSPAIDSDGTIYIGTTDDGSLVALTSSSLGLADSPWPKFRHDNRNTGFFTAKPSITTQPQSQVVNVGQNVSFSVTASGTAPLSYQWCQDGVPVVGATDTSLTLNDVQTQQAGNYTVVVTNAYGTLTSSVAVLTINRLAQTITFGALTARRVDDAPFLLNAAASSGLLVSYVSSNPGVATVTGSTVTLVSSGTTIITAVQAGDAYWAPAETVSRTLAVDPAPVTCKADDQTKTYGNVNPALSITYTGLKAGDTAPATPPVATCAATAASGVGTYPITLNGGSDPNYTLTLVPGSLTVSKRELTVTANSSARLHGAVNPAFTLSYSGFVNGDGPGDLDTLPLAVCGADAASLAGPYPIVPFGGTDRNYTFKYISGTLTILQGARMRLWVDDRAGDPVAIEFGEEDTASDDFDVPWDQIAPTTQPSRADAHLFNSQVTDPGKRNLVCDIRLCRATTRYRLIVSGVSNRGVVTLTWDVATAPPGREVYLQEVRGEQPVGFPVDMRVQPSHEITTDSEFEIAYSIPAQTRLILGAGWNLVGNPIMSTRSAAETLAGSSRVSTHLGPLWYWDSENKILDETGPLSPERGYWIYCPTAGQSAELNGVRADGLVLFKPGWNLVSPVVDCIMPTVDGMASTAWDWHGELGVYRMVAAGELLKAGRGYWIHVGAAPVSVHLGD